MEAKVKKKDELKELATKVVNLLRPEGIAIWQAKEVFRVASGLLDNEQLGER